MCQIVNGANLCKTSTLMELVDQTKIMEDLPTVFCF
jgi:hypothetical protein